MAIALRVVDEFAKNIFPGGWWEIYVWGMLLSFSMFQCYLLNTLLQLSKVQSSIIFSSACSFHVDLIGVLIL